MGCKSCEKDAISIYRELSETTGVKYFFFHNKNNNQIIVSEDMIPVLSHSGSIPLDAELILI